MAKTIKEAQAQDRAKLGRAKKTKIEPASEEVSQQSSNNAITPELVSTVEIPKFSSEIPTLNTPDIAITKPVAFSASNYTSSNPWETNTKVPVLSEPEYQQRLETVKGQQRAVSILTENLTLDNQLLKAEGLSIDGQIISVQNQGKAQDLKTAGVKLQQSAVKTGIEQARLAELTHDLNGYTAQANLKGQTWALKLDGLQHDLNTAQQMLAAKKAQLPK